MTLSATKKHLKDFIQIILFDNWMMNPMDSGRLIASSYDTNNS